MHPSSSDVEESFFSVMLRRAFSLCLNIFAFQFASNEISSFNAGSQQLRDRSVRPLLLQQGQSNQETFLEV